MLAQLWRVKGEDDIFAGHTQTQQVGGDTGFGAVFFNPDFLGFEADVDGVAFDAMVRGCQKITSHFLRG